MKSLLIRMTVILVIGLSIFSYVKVWGTNWKIYFSHELGSFYYDPQSITRPAKNIVRVWERNDFTEKGRIDCVEKLGKEYENVNRMISFIEINCSEKTRRFLSMIYYDNRGRVIYSSPSPTESSFIPPETAIENLYQAICQ